MDYLLEAYASSSSDENDVEDKAAGPSALGELPPELKNIFKDSGEIRPSSKVLLQNTFGTPSRSERDDTTHVCSCQYFIYPVAKHV